MEFLKNCLQHLLNWFKQLTKKQQLVTVGIVAITVIFGGKTLLSNGLDGNYTGEKNGVSITVTIHGKSGDMVMFYGEQKKESEIEGIDVKNKTFVLKSPESGSATDMKFEKEGNILRISESSGGEELVLVKK